MDWSPQAGAQALPPSRHDHCGVPGNNGQGDGFGMGGFPPQHAQNLGAFGVPPPNNPPRNPPPNYAQTGYQQQAHHHQLVGAGGQARPFAMESPSCPPGAPADDDARDTHARMVWDFMMSRGPFDKGGDERRGTWQTPERYHADWQQQAAPWGRPEPQAEAYRRDEQGWPEPPTWHEQQQRQWQLQQLAAAHGDQWQSDYYYFERPRDTLTHTSRGWSSPYHDPAYDARPPRWPPRPEQPFGDLFQQGSAVAATALSARQQPPRDVLGRPPPPLQHTPRDVLGRPPPPSARGPGSGGEGGQGAAGAGAGAAGPWPWDRAKFEADEARQRKQAEERRRFEERRRRKEESERCNQRVVACVAAGDAGAANAEVLQAVAAGIEMRPNTVATWLHASASAGIAPLGDTLKVLAQANRACATKAKQGRGDGCDRAGGLRVDVTSYSKMLQRLVADLGTRPAVVRMLLNLALPAGCAAVPAVDAGASPEEAVDALRSAAQLVGKAEKGCRAGDGGQKGCGEESGGESDEAADEEREEQEQEGDAGSTGEAAHDPGRAVMFLHGCEARAELDGEYARTVAFDAFMDDQRPVYVRVPDADLEMPGEAGGDGGSGVPGGRTRGGEGDGGGVTAGAADTSGGGSGEAERGSGGGGEAVCESAGGALMCRHDSPSGESAFREDVPAGGMEGVLGKEAGVSLGAGTVDGANDCGRETPGGGCLGESEREKKKEGQGDRERARERERERESQREGQTHRDSSSSSSSATSDR